ncbi:Uncharacterised protein [Budvicia aquatica]|uniref:Uncharacterized protein n=1 Tax=Budvicia aquatica TaxID=82979 RepID=A0A484Z9X3_9GAMM|nr:Uncharacterised protein [Budvicia aquatica]
MKITNNQIPLLAITAYSGTGKNHAAQKTHS